MIEEIGGIPIRMEEEEEDGSAGYVSTPSMGFIKAEPPIVKKEPTSPISTDARRDFLAALVEERKKILSDDKLSARQKKDLLDENRKTLVVANGGVVRKTDSIVYGILMFGAVVLITLALLTTFAGLPSEVTLSFVGTVLGGTIATIAQKLGKL